MKIGKKHGRLGTRSVPAGTSWGKLRRERAQQMLKEIYALKHWVWVLDSGVEPDKGYDFEIKF